MSEVSNFIINFFFKLGLKDTPGKLKNHGEDIPIVGGLLFLSVTLISSIFISFNNYTNLYLLVIFIIIGIWDDIKNLNPNFKFFVTFFSLILVIIFDLDLQIKLINFKYFENIFIPYNKYLNILIPTICLMLLLNSFNMSDGINGLASGIFLSWSIYLLIKFPFITNILFPFIISVLFFLYFNLKNKAFLGDGGNYCLSMILGTAIIKINNYDTMIISAEEIFLIFIIPGIDMLRLFIVRIIEKRNPFNGDRQHFHHYLLKKYGTSKSLIIYLLLINIPLYIFYFFNLNLIILIVLSLITYFLLLRIAVLKKI
tara:strand:- start:27464 stop:28402 length:939 start_codon:yes stop_codon:yes gene_type:complete